MMDFTKLYQYIWPLEPSKRTRIVPMKVLALGLPRTGTESLCQALTILGFEHTYHGYDVLTRYNDNVNWCQLMAKKQQGEIPTATDFDAVIGHCQAVTDVPCAVFAADLIAAYPEAKIIINRRDNIDDWYTSIVNTLVRTDEQGRFIGQLLFAIYSRKNFWMLLMYWRTQKYHLWRGDIRAQAKAAYRDHYAWLEANVSQERGLRWTTQDGWEPLCRFLEVPVPDILFPKGNDPVQHSQKIDPVRRRMFVNISIVASVLVAICALAAYLLRL